jgi:hypothetical protein
LGVSAAILLAGVLAASYSHPAAVSQKNVLRGSLDQPGIQQSQAKVQESVAKLPLAFEPNLGQTDARVKYVARAKGYTAFLTENETVLSIKGSAKGSAPGVLRMNMPNARPATRLETSDPQVARSNYLKGDRSKWITDVANYGRVTAKEVYPGIDVAYHGNQRTLEYDFVVKPGADSNQIRVAYEGSSRFALDAAGNLELETAAGRTLAQKPIAYQTIHGVRKPVKSEYVLTANNQVGFKLGAYDRSQALIIDPTIQVLAYIGGLAADEGFGIFANSTGVFITGRTQSLDFPASPNPLAEPIVVFSSDGTATIPSVFQRQHFTTGVDYDAYVAKLDQSGTTLVYSTYLGGVGDDSGEGIAADSLGNAYVTGYTSANMGPTAIVSFSGTYAAFVAKLSTTGQQLLAFTYFGGAGVTEAFSLAIDPSNNVIIGGLTNNLVTANVANGFQKTFGAGSTSGNNTTDGFLAKFDSGLNFLPGTATYLGGGQYDQVNSVATDTSGNVYAAGVTASGNTAAPATVAAFPVKSAIAVGTINSGSLIQTGFLVKLNSSLSSQSYGSIFGVGGETANGVAVDPSGVAYVVGATRNFNFYPTSNPTVGGNLVASGSLPTAATTVQPGNCVAFTGQVACVTSGTPIPAVPPVGLANPTNPSPAQTQGYLLSFSGSGNLNYVALGAATAPDVTNNCLNLTKNGALLGTGISCNGFFASWNSVAVDADAQAYVTGQQPLPAAGPTTYYAAPIVRFNRVGTTQANPVTVSNGAGNGNNLAYGIAVNNSTREAFFAGDTTATTGTAGALTTMFAANTANFPLVAGVPAIAGVQQGLKITNWASNAGLVAAVLGPFTTPTLFGIVPPNAQNYGSTALDGGASVDLLYGALQYNDVVLSSNSQNATITLTPIGLFGPTGSNGPTQTLSLLTPANQASSCSPVLLSSTYVRPLTTVANTGTFITQPIPVPPFAAALLPGTNSLAVTYSSSATLGTFNAILTLTCAGAENTAITLNVTGTVQGSVNAAPQNALTNLTSAFGSGIVKELFNTIIGPQYGAFNNFAVPVTVTLPSTNDFCATSPNNNSTTPGAPGLGSLAGSSGNLTGCPYTVAIASGSTNTLPTGCNLITLSTGTTVGNGFPFSQSGSIYTIANVGLAHPLGITPTFANGGSFNVNINSSCASTLSPGTYGANITATSGAGITAATVPFSLTINSGGIISQGLLNLSFTSNTAAAQQTSFSVNSQGALSLTYGINYVPANPPNTPLPSANVLVVSGGLGTVPAGGTNAVVVQVNPVGLANGVYNGTFQVTVPGTNPLQVVQTISLTVYVGTGIGVQTPATTNNALNVSVPSGFPWNNLTQPANIVITALSAPFNTQLTVGLPTLSGFANLPAGTSACVVPTASQASPPANLAPPQCAIQIAPQNGDSCATYAPNPQDGRSATCSYRVRVDTTLVPAGTYSGTATFTSGASTAVVNISVTVTPFPSLVVSSAASFVAPVSSLTFTGTAGVDQTNCQTLWVAATGGQVNNVTMVSTANWLGFQFPGNIGNPATGFQTSFNFGTVSANGFSGVNVCVNAVGQPNRPATLTANITVGGAGVGQPVIFPVTYILSGGSGNPANFQQLAVFRNQASGLGQFAFDRNENYNYDNPPDNFRNFGLNGDKAVAGDWFGTGVVSIGVFRCPVLPAVGVCQWYIDANNNGTWDGIAGGDAIWNFGLSNNGLTYDQPIVGDWTGDGISKIGVMRCPVLGQPGICTWYLDAGNQHGLSYTLQRTAQFGLPGDQPVANNWNGGGNVDQIGVFRCPLGGTPLAPIAGTCSWLVDSNGTAATNPNPGTTYPTFGLTGDIPIVGNWFGTGRKRIGVFRGGPNGVLLNLSGANTTGATSVDYTGNFGVAGDQPVVGFWTLP